MAFLLAYIEAIMYLCINKTKPLEPRPNGKKEGKKSMTQKELNEMVKVARKHIADCPTLQDLAYAISKETPYTEEEIFECYIDDIMNNL